jgi:hypothetical protein
VSLAAGLACAGLIWWLARRITGRHVAGAFAALLFVGLGLPSLPYAGGAPWMAFYRVDMLGVAFGLGSIALLSARTSRRATIGANPSRVWPILVKQTLIAWLLAGTWWTWQRDEGSVIWVAEACLLPVAIAVITLDATTKAILANTVPANASPIGGAVLAEKPLLLSQHLGRGLVAAISGRIMYIPGRLGPMVPCAP